MGLFRFSTEENPILRIREDIVVDKSMNQKWISVDVLLISIIVGLMVWQIMYIGYAFISSLAMILVGVLLLLSKKLKDRLYTSRALYWISTNVSRPRSEINHIVWGIIMIIIGTIVAFASYDMKNKFLFSRSIRDRSLWVLVFSALLVNIAIGFYTARKKRRSEAPK